MSERYGDIFVREKENMSHRNNPEHSLPYYIRGAFREFETALGRYLAPYNIPLSQFYILRLQWNEAGNSQIDISERSFMSESVASQVIKKMEENDLVRRKPDPSDRRSRLVLLTPKGKAIRDKIMQDGIKISKENTPDISPEDIRTTMEVLLKVRRGFEALNRQSNLRP